MSTHCFNRKKKLPFGTTNRELVSLPSGKTHRKAGYYGSKNTGLFLQCRPEVFVSPWFTGGRTLWHDAHCVDGEEALEKSIHLLFKRCLQHPWVSHRETKFLLSQSGSHRLVIQQAGLLRAEERQSQDMDPRPSAFRTQILFNEALRFLSTDSKYIRLF